MGCDLSGNKFNFKKSFKNTYYLYVEKLEPSKAEDVALLWNMSYFRSWLLVLLCLCFEWIVLHLDYHLLHFSVFTRSASGMFQADEPYTAVSPPAALEKNLFHAMEFCRKAFPKIWLNLLNLKYFFFINHLWFIRESKPNTSSLWLCFYFQIKK